jgi:hypothetical protein
MLTMALRQEPWDSRSGKAHHRGNVQADQVFDCVQIGICEAAEIADASVVNQQADTGVFPQASLDVRKIVAVRQVGGEDVDHDTGLGAQAGGEIFHTLLVTGHKDKVVASPGEAVGIGGPDAGGGASDQGGGVGDNRPLATKPPEDLRRLGQNRMRIPALHYWLVQRKSRTSSSEVSLSRC